MTNARRGMSAAEIQSQPDQPCVLETVRPRADGKTLPARGLGVSSAQLSSPSPGNVRLQICGQTLDLHPSHCAFWLERRTLIVADLHLGKAAAFRQNGLAVPEGGTEDDLARLEKVLGDTAAERLIIVGDLFHSPSGYQREVFEAIGAWRRKHPDLRLTLVPGNHDRQLERVPREWDVDIRAARLADSPFTFAHDPSSVDPGSFFICGHLHPAIRLGHSRQSSLCAACFWLRRNLLVLPGFGSFTGRAVIRPETGDRVFSIARHRVTEVPESLW
ncbi:MAG: ligase-associated DNA damage response endonuclease PdeM [Verrucomicrobiales bacterium]